MASGSGVIGVYTAVGGGGGGGGGGLISKELLTPRGWELLTPRRWRRCMWTVGRPHAVFGVLRSRVISYYGLPLMH